MTFGAKNSWLIFFLWFVHRSNGPLPRQHACIAKPTAYFDIAKMDEIARDLGAEREFSVKSMSTLSE